jgi:hypothetical protein
MQNQHLRTGHLTCRISTCWLAIWHAESALAQWLNRDRANWDWILGAICTEHWNFPRFSTHFRFKIWRQLHTFFGQINNCRNCGFMDSYFVTCSHSLTWLVVTMDVVYPSLLRATPRVLSFQPHQIKIGWRKVKTCSVSWPNKLKLDEEKSKHAQYPDPTN